MGPTFGLPGETPARKSPEQGNSGRYNRVAADLADPTSIKNAVEQSGAKAVFTYVQRVPGGMKMASDALKGAGVEYVILLSSYTVKGDLHDIPQQDFIPFHNAQGEMAMQDAGLDLFSVRPGYFVSNPVHNELDRSKSPVQVNVLNAHGNHLNPIDPEDIGRVCGSVLVDRPSGSRAEAVYLHGPETMPNNSIWETVKEVTGQPIEIHHLTKEQYISIMGKKYPPGVGEYFASKLENFASKLEKGMTIDRQADNANVKRYTGRDATRFAEYVAKHTGDFTPLNSP